MRILIAIPHFFLASDPAAINRSHRPLAKEERAGALRANITALISLFGSRAHGLDHFGRISWQAAPSMPHDIDIVICTTGDAHLVASLGWLPPLCRHYNSKAEPAMLGFECHKVLAEARGRYDYYGYLEDDVVITDALFFRKRRLFDGLLGPEALLQPNRYEFQLQGTVRKLYVDYRLAPQLTAAYQDITQQPRLQMAFVDETIFFERTSYPSAGCFFLNAEQLERWRNGPHFLDGDVSYFSPLDSAATLSVMKSFRIYKSVLDQAEFLEVLHASPRWIGSAAQSTHLIARQKTFEPFEISASPPKG